MYLAEKNHESVRDEWERSLFSAQQQGTISALTCVKLFALASHLINLKIIVNKFNSSETWRHKNLILKWRCWRAGGRCCLADGWHLLFVQQELAEQCDGAPLALDWRDERGNSQFHGSQALLWKMRWILCYFLEAPGGAFWSFFSWNGYSSPSNHKSPGFWSHRRAAKQHNQASFPLPTPRRKKMVVNSRMTT